MKRKIWFLVVFLCFLADRQTDLFAQTAFYVREDISEMSLKSEATLKWGLVLPVGPFASAVTELGLAQGARIGTGVNLSYNYYFVPYFGLGLSLGGQWLGYDFNQALQGKDYVGKLHSTGWQVYSIGLSLNLRVPLVRNFYLIGQIQGHFGMMVSPIASSVETIERIDSEGNKLDSEKKKTSLIRAQTRADFILGGELGFQYRIIKNVLAQITVDYRYAITNNKADRQSVPVSESPILEFRYAAFTVNLGVSYAF